MSAIAERVARGVEWLDENEEGWPARIDVGELNVRSCCACVIGQALGCFTETFPFDNITEAAALGFTTDGAYLTTDDYDAEMDGLAAEWRRVITERRAAA